MKKNLLILALFIIPVFSFSQSGTVINYVDNFGPATCVYDGIVNGKHSYKEAAIKIYIYWSGSRWEIEFDGFDLLFHSDIITAMNPPNFVIGMWQDSDLGDGTDLVSLSGTGTTSVVLPVELSSFKANSKQKDILLSWSTASEINNEKFEVERSQKTDVFVGIGEVEGYGTTHDNQQYNFIDIEPHNGINNYRLKQIDYDGNYKYSKIVSVNYTGDNGLFGTFYPNPNKSGILYFDYNSKNNREIDMAIFDLNGKLMNSQVKSVSEGVNKIEYSYSELNSGVYILLLEDGKTSNQQKLKISKR